MSLTKIASKLFLPRQKELIKHYTTPDELQHSVLKYLILKGKETEYGRNHMFDSMDDYDSFAKNIPINTYEEPQGRHRPHASWRTKRAVARSGEMVRQVIRHHQRQVKVHPCLQCRLAQHPLQGRRRRGGLLLAQQPQQPFVRRKVAHLRRQPFTQLQRGGLIGG